MKTTAWGFVLTAALATRGAMADPVSLGVVYDPFPGSSCASASCDVIGENSAFDVQKIELLQGAGTFIVKIYTNYDHNTPPPNPWSYTSPGAHPPTLNLNIGDLFFTFGGVLTYGVALPAGGHDGFVQDGLYRVASTQTASQVLGIHSHPASSWIFRDNAPVWLGGTAPAQPLAQGAHQVSIGGNGVSNSKWILTVTLPTAPLAPLWSDLRANHQTMGVYFASNTCGNDIIDGKTNIVPEPNTALLALGGLMLALAGRRVFRTQGKK